MENFTMDIMISTMHVFNILAFHSSFHNNKRNGIWLSEADCVPLAEGYFIRQCCNFIKNVKVDEIKGKIPIFLEIYHYRTHPLNPC